MRKFKYLFALLLAIIFFHGFAEKASASLIHQEDGIFPNHSAEYIRTLNRNASTDVDAAFYNPAGLVFMKDGLHFMFSNQTMVVNRKIVNTLGNMWHYFEGGFSQLAAPTVITDWAPNALSDSTYTGRKYEKYNLDVFAPMLPDFDIVYKLNKLAAFFNFAILQATPTSGIKYKDGVPTLDNGLITIFNGFRNYDKNLAVEPNKSYTDLVNLTRNSTYYKNEMYMSATIGGAYKIIEMLSASLGARFIYAKLTNEIKASNIVYTPVNPDWYIGNWNTVLDPFKDGVDIETDSTGFGMGFIAGTDLKPAKDLNIGLRFEYYTPLIVKNKNRSFVVPFELASSGELDVLRDGVKTAVTFPPSASIGISYNIIKPLRIEASFDYYFRRSVDYGPEVSDDIFLFTVDNMNAKHRMRKDHWNNGYRVGGAVEFEVISGLKLSTGYNYNYTGFKSQYRNEGRVLLNNHSIGGGAGYAVTEKLSLNVGFMYMIMVSDKVDRIDSNVALSALAGNYNYSWMKVHQTFKEYRYIIALGASYRMDIGSAETTEADAAKPPKARI